jgi:hypothetical protein
MESRAAVQAFRIRAHIVRRASPMGGPAASSMTMGATS